MLGPFATMSRLTPIHQMSLAVPSRAACASMSTTTTTCDRGDRYGPMEWAQLVMHHMPQLDRSAAVESAVITDQSAVGPTGMTGEFARTWPTLSTMMCGVVMLVLQNSHC